MSILAMVEAVQDYREMKQRVLEALKPKLAEHDLPGLSVAWRSESESDCIAIGHADRESAEPLSPQHRMLAGSVGKTFTAASVLALALGGIVDLDASIAVWLDRESWFDDLPNGREMSLRMLLSHTSGIADHRVAPLFIDALTRELTPTRPNPDLYFSPPTLLSHILDQPASFQPDTDFSYSETGYILSGMIIERASGEQFYERIRRLFLNRFSLDQTLPADRRDLPCSMAQGYVEDNDIGIPQLAIDDGMLALNPASEWAGGGFVSTASDLARWAEILFIGCALEGPYLHDLMERTVSTGDPGYHYGLGCYQWHTRFGDVYGHSGEALGYRSIMAYFPKHRTAMSIQINTSRTAHSILLELMQSFAAAVFVEEPT